jgi:hypothetical protein
VEGAGPVKLLNLGDVAINPANVAMIVDEVTTKKPVLVMVGGDRITVANATYADLVIQMNEAIRG